MQICAEVFGQVEDVFPEALDRPLSFSPDLILRRKEDEGDEADEGNEGDDDEGEDGGDTTSVFHVVVAEKKLKKKSLFNSTKQKQDTSTTTHTL